jgi:hypothetical protein
VLYGVKNNVRTEIKEVTITKQWNDKVQHDMSSVIKQKILLFLLKTALRLCPSFCLLSDVNSKSQHYKHTNRFLDVNIASMILLLMIAYAFRKMENNAMNDWLSGKSPLCISTIHVVTYIKDIC